MLFLAIYETYTEISNFIFVAFYISINFSVTEGHMAQGHFCLRQLFSSKKPFFNTNCNVPPIHSSVCVKHISMTSEVVKNIIKYVKFNNLSLRKSLESEKWKCRE